MNIRTRTLAFSFVLVSASAALGIAACSSSSTTATGPDTTGDSGGSGNVDSGSGGGEVDGGGGGGNVDGGGGGTDSGGGTCMTPPKLFPPKPDGGMYCPFSNGGDGGTKYCKTPAQMCCLSPSADAGPSDCEAVAAACTNTAFSTWECSAPSECAGNAAGPVCCLIAGPLEPDPNCSGYQKTKGFDATKCMAAGKCTGTVVVGKYTDNQTIVCEAQADCPAGTTCTAVKTSGTSIGLCL